MVDAKEEPDKNSSRLELCITAISVRDRDGDVYVSCRGDDGRRVVLRVRGFEPWITVAIKGSGSMGRAQAGAYLGQCIRDIWPQPPSKSFRNYGTAEEGCRYYGDDDGEGYRQRRQQQQQMSYAPYSSSSSQYSSYSAPLSFSRDPFLSKPLCGYAKDRDLAFRLRFANESKRRSAAFHLEKSAKQTAEKCRITVAADNRVDASTQFQLDTGLRVWGWISVEKSLCTAALGRELMGEISALSSPCPLAADVRINATRKLDGVDPLPDRDSDLPPIRVLYWDIETMPAATRKAGDNSKRGGISFEFDDVMIIGCVAKTLYGPGPPSRYVAFCGPTAEHPDASLDAAADASETQVEEEYVVCASTREMLLRWKRYALMEFDADVLVAYNSRGFDLRMLFGAARRVGCASEFSNGGWSILSSDCCDLMEPKKASGSKQRGFNESYKLSNSFGRFELDLLVYLMSILKLRSYKLSAVCKQFLPEEKEESRKIELSYEDMWANVATARGRADNARYCIRDCAVLHQLMMHFECLVQMVEMSRLTLTGLEDLLSRGQTLKITNQLALACHQRGYIMNPSTSGTWSPAGATVLEPKCGFYVDPVITMDFASLYPSIMRAHNLCMSTLVAGDPAAGSDGVVFHEIRDPKEGNGAPVLRRHGFHTKEVGLLSIMLKGFLDARASVRNLMKTEKDPRRLAVLNGRQLALKVSANSIYGFTGAPVTPWYTPAITETVTAIGRNMIEATKETINSRVTWRFLSELAAGQKSPGPPMPYEKRAVVIYGDTDSVMVLMPPLEGFDDSGAKTALERCIEWAPFLAKWLTDELFIVPIVLEYEKTYWPYLLLRKKRYAGMLYGNSPHKGYIDSKGTCDVRRDSFLVTSDLLVEIKNELIGRGDKAAALAAVERVLDDLVKDRIPRAKYVMSNELRPASSYTNPENTAHLVLAQRMEARAPGSGPRTGERVQYVIAKKKTSGATASPSSEKMVDKLEDPDYAEAHGIPIDRLYYLNHCFKKPIVDFIGSICPEVSGAIERAAIAIEHDRTKQRVFVATSCAPTMPRASPCPPAHPRVTQRGEQQQQHTFSFSVASDGSRQPPLKKAKKTGEGTSSLSSRPSQQRTFG